jgi:hypothetical protein
VSRANPVPTKNVKGYQLKQQNQAIDSYIISIYFVFFYFSFRKKLKKMFNLGRLLSINLVARNFGKNSTKKLFASTSVLAENKDSKLDDRVKEATKRRLSKSK